MCQVMKNFQKCLKPQFYVEKDFQNSGAATRFYLFIYLFKKECVEGSRSNTPYINSSGPGNDVAFLELRTFLTRLGVMGDMSKACPNLSSGR